MKTFEKRRQKSVHKVKKIHAFVEENTGFTKKDVRWALLFQKKLLLVRWTLFFKKKLLLVRWTLCDKNLNCQSLI